MQLDTLAASPNLLAITIMGSGRLGPTIAALLGLAAVVFGARARARARRPVDRISQEAREDRIALLLGMVAVLLGALFFVAADGGPGTGNGVAGSIAAIILGSVAVGLDRAAAGRRSHRSDSAATKLE